jgi:hypothetical protein
VWVRFECVYGRFALSKVRSERRKM